MKQRNKSDCVIASLATVTGQSYKTVKSCYGRLERGGMFLHECRWILSQFGVWHEIKPRKPTKVSQWLRRHNKGRYLLILLSDPFLGGAHAVASIDGTIHGDYSDQWNILRFYAFKSKPIKKTD